MKKITKGFYEATINNFTVHVIKTNVDSEIVWYNSISKNNKLIFEGTDFYSTKKEAFEAISYVANNPIEYNIK